MERLGTLFRDSQPHAAEDKGRSSEEVAQPRRTAFSNGYIPDYGYRGETQTSNHERVIPRVRQPYGDFDEEVPRRPAANASDPTIRSDASHPPRITAVSYTHLTLPTIYSV